MKNFKLVTPTLTSPMVSAQTSDAVSGDATGNERMRIDSSGNVLFGTTNSSASAGVGAKYVASATAPLISVVGSDSTSSYAGYYLYSTGAGAYRFYVNYAGTIYATSTSITQITSDVNLKTDIVDYDKGLKEVMAMKPRYFKYKAEPTEQKVGFIAQEMDEALPGSMITSPGTDHKTYQLEWYPILVKAIQELKSELDAVKSELAALKG